MKTRSSAKSASSELHIVGLNFVVGLAASELTEGEVSALKTLRPAGIILFAHNVTKGVDWPEKLRDLIKHCRELVGREDLLVSIDHEGGAVNRLPAPATHFPAARFWAGQMGAVGHAGEVGHAMGRELRALTINLDFAPVLDIHSNPENKVIGTRAFGTEPEIVIECAKAFMQGLQSEGVLACGKHFPGHGDTVADSHHELPVHNEPREIIEQRELLPFKALISAGLQLIMTAHVRYKSLDSEQPATLSKKIITDLLRTKLGFAGTVISDAVEMGALTGIPYSAVGAQIIAAGGDLLLVGIPKGVTPLTRAVEIGEGILAELNRQSEVSAEVLRESHKRINALFSYAKNLRQKSRQSSYSVDLLGCDPHRALCDKLGRS